MNRSIRYSKISTLSQLRNERARLESDITNKELLLNLQYREITEYFSIANMISLFVSRINSLTPLFSWVQSAFNFIRSLFRNDDTDNASVVVDDTVEKPSVIKQKKRRSEKSTTPPAKKTVTTKRKGQNRVKSIKKEKLSESERPDAKQSIKKPTVKRSARSKNQSSKDQNIL